jgi:kynureninase
MISLANHLDSIDELAAFRQRFAITDPDTIYLDGNSLGRLPLATVDQLKTVVEKQWGERLVRGWNESWMDAPRRAGDKIAVLLGARPGEILVSDSTSVNLFKLAAAALRYQSGRNEIISDELNFPSDLYILQGISQLLAQGHQITLLPSRDSIQVKTTDVDAALGKQTALLSLSHVAFKSAFLYKMQEITALAHMSGALALWDLSHSAGVVPIKLNAWDVDLAVGCTYKYLNSGPGAPAFLYVREDLQEKLLQPIWGWFGSANAFQFNQEYTPAPGIARFAVGTPPILSLSAIEIGVEMLLEAGVRRVRTKSMRQTEYLIALAQEWLLPLGFSFGTPLNPARRGSHVALRHPEAYRINRAMIEAVSPRVIPDFRAPDNLRLGISPLYTSYDDILRALLRMKEIVAKKEYEAFSAAPLPVT